MFIDGAFVNADVISGLFRSQQVTSILTGNIQEYSAAVQQTGSSQPQRTLDYGALLEQFKLQSEAVQAELEIAVREDVAEKLDTLKQLAADPTQENQRVFSSILAELEPMTYYDLQFQQIGISGEYGLSELSIANPEAAEQAIESLDAAIADNDTELRSRSESLEVTLNSIEKQEIQNARSLNYDFLGIVNSIQDLLSPGRLVNVLL